MGVIQSALGHGDEKDSSSFAPADSRGRQSVEQLHLSWVSNKLQKDLTNKFSELELLSLRQVLAQLKQGQEKAIKEVAKAAKAHHEAARASDMTPADRTSIEASTATASPTATAATTPVAPVVIVPGITEETFVKYLGFPEERNQAGHLFFRSFYHLSIYPDNTEALVARQDPPNLTSRDFIKPLALYCQKIRAGINVDVDPLRAIFESFAQTLPPPTSLPIKAALTEGNLATDTLDIDPLQGQGSLKRSKTMEDSLKDLTLQSNFEWNPEEDDFMDSGPKVKAEDLVHVVDGLFWLSRRVIEDNPEGAGAFTPSDPSKLADPVHRQQQATSIVERLIQYSRNASHVHDPINLATEMIDYGMFSKFVKRNAPNIFHILSQFFYSRFLVGTTMRSTQSVDESKLVLLGDPAIPALNAPSSILTPEQLTVISWFLPPKATAPILTNLYSGSKNGFSMNQFEVHVCKYPAPTLLLLLVERQMMATPTTNRRKSISFGTTSARHRHSLSSNSPPYSIPWGSDNRRSSLDKLTGGRSPTTPVSAGSVLNTIFDGVVAEPAPEGEDAVNPLSPAVPRKSVELGTPPVSSRKMVKERMILGAYVTETWKVSKSGWGNDSFALFELDPCFEVFPAKKTAVSPTSNKSSGSRGGAGGISTSARSLPNRVSPTESNTPGSILTNRHYVHFLKNAGVGFGGQESESCMLYIDDNLRYGNYRQDFAGGNVYMSAGGARQAGFEVDFEVVECEVWGLGGPDAKGRQQKEWDFEQREANRRASIHLRGKDGEQDIDRDLLEMAGVLDPDRGHRHARRQSAFE